MNKEILISGNFCDCCLQMCDKLLKVFRMEAYFLKLFLLGPQYVIFFEYAPSGFLRVTP